MPRKSIVDLYLILLLGAAVVSVYLLSVVVSILSSLASALVEVKWPILITAALAVLIYGCFLLYIHFYFKSKKFENLRNSISEYINNCNQLNHHIAELKGSYINIQSYDYGSSSIIDSSKYKFKRTEWSKSTRNNYVHNCSSSVCKRADDQPMKYLCKYFDIQITEESLSNIEEVLNNFSAAEEGKYLLHEERKTILRNAEASIPRVISRFRKEMLIKKLGFEDIDLSDLYFPVYTFQYVSPGGNSSMTCPIKLDIDNLEKLIHYLRSLVTFRKSIQGQRALMTSSLREKIKNRDQYTCRHCGLSTDDEPNLLLEIDHITPLSKGGITSEENLQTLCWKCNRAKGSKLLSDLA